MKFNTYTIQRVHCSYRLNSLALLSVHFQRWCLFPYIFQVATDCNVKNMVSKTRGHIGGSQQEADHPTTWSCSGVAHHDTTNSLYSGNYGGI